MFTWETLWSQCHHLILRQQTLWFNHRKDNLCSHKAVKDLKKSASLGPASRPGKITRKNKLLNLKTFGCFSSATTHAGPSTASYPWDVTAALAELQSSNVLWSFPVQWQYSVTPSPTVPTFFYHCDKSHCSLEFLNIFLILTLFPSAHVFLWPRKSV